LAIENIILLEALSSRVTFANILDVAQEGNALRQAKWP
jgi:hypothetical protein